MSIDNNRLADKVVAAFKNILSDEAMTAISEKELHELNLIVREALSQQLSSAAEQVEETARQLKSMTDHQDIGL